MENDTNRWVFYVDDGGGMDTEGIRKCMSLGYSSKKANTTIGQCNYNKLFILNGEYVISLSQCHSYLHCFLWYFLFLLKNAQASFTMVLGEPIVWHVDVWTNMNKEEFTNSCKNLDCHYD